MSEFEISDSHQKLINLIENKYSLNPIVLDAFRQIPRKNFIDGAFQLRAYEDFPLPILENQTISQPSLVAKITDIAINNRNIPFKQVLEIGAGSGFQAAILSKIANRVYSVERIQSLVEKAKSNISKLKIKNVYLLHESEMAIVNNQKFEAIIFSAGFSGNIPRFWIDLLEINGVLVFPYRQVNKNDNNYQLTSIIKKTEDTLETKVHMDVSFVPYIQSTN